MTMVLTHDPRRREDVMRRVLLAVALFVATPAPSQEVLSGRLTVIDGDTIWHYDCARGEGCRPEKIRLLDIDAPESRRSACEAELAAGLRAKERLVELLRARPVTIQRCDRHGEPCEDRFGRTLARLMTPAGEVGAILIRERLALPYIAGRKADRNRHWCGG